jgi:hypothetical protein
MLLIYSLASSQSCVSLHLHQPSSYICCRVLSLLLLLLSLDWQHLFRPVPVNPHQQRSGSSRPHHHTQASAAFTATHNSSSSNNWQLDNAAADAEQCCQQQQQQQQQHQGHSAQA